MIRKTAYLFPRLDLLAVTVFALFGVAFRLRQYLFNRSLALDEASLALNVVNRDLFRLLTEPLAFGQSAPPGFLVASRLLVVTIGPFDWVLRLVPLAAGLLLVVLAAVLARRELHSTVARLTFVGLIALSPVLIYYSSEFKQYSSDALAALAILLAFSFRKSRLGTWLLASVGFIGLVGSLPALFVAAPVGLLLIYQAIRSHRYKEVLIVGIAWFAAVAIHGIYIFQAHVDRELIERLGERGLFVPFPPASINDFLWYARAFSGLTYLSFRNEAFAGYKIHTASNGNLSDFWGWTLALAFALSLVLALFERRWVCLLSAGAILLTSVVSAFWLYPFVGRVLIFAVPLIFLLIAAAIDTLAKKIGPMTASVAALVLVGLMTPVALKGMLEPRFGSDLRGALGVINQNSIPGDVLIVDGWSRKIFEFYKPALKRELTTLKFSLTLPEASAAVIDEVAEKNLERVWFLIAHRAKEAERFVDEIGRAAAIEFKWNASGTILILVDFRRRLAPSHLGNCVIVGSSSIRLAMLNPRTMSLRPVRK